MKKINLIALVLCILIICSFSKKSHSQPFSIGHKQITFTDPARSNRAIQTEIYYPATTAGENTPFASGQFPIIVFGHGFVMVWSAYQWLWDLIVPNGYIMAFPRTEGSLSPNHAEFGLDLAFLNTFIKSENSNSSSFFYQHVLPQSAIMGHSMGGGASFLAAANNTDLTALINFAPANTTPSSINAAANVTVPLLMFEGQNDGVAPPATHQVPMYESCGSSCKTKVTILGGGHCFFADYNFNCSFGEGTTSPQPTITMAEQHTAVFYILEPYLEFVLKNSSIAESSFMNRLTSYTEISYIRDCATGTGILEKSNSPVIYFANPVCDNLNLEIIDIELPVTVEVFDLTGKRLKSLTTGKSDIEINMQEYEAATYIVTVGNGDVSLRKIFQKICR